MIDDRTEPDDVTDPEYQRFDDDGGQNHPPTFWMPGYTPAAAELSPSERPDLSDSESPGEVP